MIIISIFSVGNYCSQMNFFSMILDFLRHVKSPTELQI
nr:MAG TPA: hypothetical protein [Caudoviricetes sp.]